MPSPRDDAGAPHELAINQLAALGLFDGTTGEQGADYRHAAPMARDDMAQYLVNAYTIITGKPMGEGPDAFTDDNGSDNEAAINSLAAEGVVVGTGGGLYDPDGTVTRGQMASYIARFLEVLNDADVSLTPITP